MVEGLKKHAKNIAVGAGGVMLAGGSVINAFAAEADTNIATIMGYMPQFITLGVVGAILYKVKNL
ncbi:hypothetical protein R9X47_27125 [Wukongibacter baidiensis]|uniref:hypothetical protein n=1 Tax=Wukongibacter baidiensis TaxID=1723361 RepID=UPI003D7F5437